MLVGCGLRLSQQLKRCAVSRFFRNDACPPKNIAQEDPQNHIVWLDMEMTGMEKWCHILEVACVITDKNLNIISEDLSLVIHQPKEAMSTLSSWSLDQHGKSGLLEESRTSDISVAQAENILLSFLQKYVPRGKCPIAGNSVYMDKMFLDNYMPLVSYHLDYKMIDVTSISELIKRWYSFKEPELTTKVSQHRALPDIKQSIEQLRHYRHLVFMKPGI